jgi:hypothetical protein
VGLAALARIALGADLKGALAAVPAGPGVGQILGPDGQSLVIGTASNLRSWAGARLGLARKPPSPGGRARRPRTSLAGIATAVAWAEADGPFRQRLVYERLSARHVPPAARRDLRPPFFLHLDPRERFPRASVRAEDEGYGPFRDRRAAEKARDALQRAFALRPCDFSFEPDPALPLGLACLYAQVRSCAAPCLARVSEEGYRGLAAEAAAWLGDPRRRADAPAAIPSFVAAASPGARALVVDAGRRGVGLYPLRGGRVLDEAALVVARGELDAAVDRLEWPEADADAPSDWPWLAAWLASATRRASFVVVSEAASTGERRALVRGALGEAFATGVAGGNVGPSQEDR